MGFTVWYFQAIIPEKSEVKMMGTKVEIILKKEESFSWPTLEIQQEKKKDDTEDEAEK